MLPSAFLLEFKINYLKECVATPIVDSNSPCKDLLFPCGPNLTQKPLYLVGTVLKLDRVFKKYFVSGKQKIFCLHTTMYLLCYQYNYWVINRPTFVPFSNFRLTIAVFRLIAILTVYKQVFWCLNFANHRTKESFVSTANKPLVGTLMTIGDVTVSIAIGLLFRFTRHRIWHFT